MKESPYFKQAQLMLRVMPHVAAEHPDLLGVDDFENWFMRFCRSRALNAREVNAWQWRI
jgi:hypothetical protein